ncbi:hypothetical protein JCM12294_37890 [Desulfocicer niacini]
MIYTSEKYFTCFLKAFGLVLFLFFFMGCLSGQQQETSTSSLKMHAEKRIVTSMEYKSEQPAVNLSADGKLVYTSIKQTDPYGVVLYLPATSIDDAVTDISLVGEPVKLISALYADENRNTAKIEILLQDDFQYEVVETENGINILFFMESGYQEKKRLATPPKKDVSGDSDQPFVLGEDGHGNTVIFTQQTLPQNLPDSSDSSLNPLGGDIPLAMPSQEPVIFSNEETKLADISFSAKESGESVLTVETLTPVKYDLQKDGNDSLKLYLYNTLIPPHHQRPLIMTYFNSAVAQALPIQGIPGQTLSCILIDLKQPTPYRIYRDSNQLKLVFDPITKVGPRFEQAKTKFNAGVQPALAVGTSLSPLKQAVSNTALKEPVQLNTVSPEPETNADPLAALNGEEPVYTGEKISLDFYETDIKNVFRILRTISGENFAVDKDVSGNVTLTLDNPVPWDQVLDLVLKMNGLGKVREGDIIRIATQATLKKELTIRQEELAARQKAIEQQKQLEPLITEYIPINYSDAEKDIKPHLEKLLTPKRGQLSVDTRTNMILITDVREKIVEAKNMINRLDTVTPQIMISARVVEVSKDFSRELGIEWGVSSQDVYRDDLGGTYGFDVAMNYPATSNSSLSYTFNRVVGTPFSINAKLTAAEAKGDVKIVSSPRILTMDNKKASIKQGIEYAYLERDDTGGSSVKFKDIDLLLEVTPHVTPDKRVTMTVHITKNDLDSITDGIPSLSTNEAETELLVNDGNTIVIGGIVKTSTTDSSTGFPLLSDIPVLGHLFRSDKDTEKKNELLIFLTPTIVQLDQKMQN